MAAIGPETSTRQQLAAIAGVRWRFMVNSLRTTRGRLELVAQIWTGLWFAFLGIAGIAGFAIATWFFLHQGHPLRLAWLLWPLFLFWQIFPLASSVFMEHGDTSYLARFPLTYRAYFWVRVAFGALDAATLVGACCLTGLLIGAAAAAPLALIWTVPAVLLFAAFNLLLAQMIFAWLERWLAGRRTREIIAVLFFLAIFSVNFIGPLARHWRGGTAAAAWKSLAPYILWLPPSLAVHAVAAAAWRHAAALLALAAWTVAVAKLLDLRFRSDFRGETVDSGASPAPVRSPARAVAAPIAARPRPTIPAIPGPVGAVAGKELRYLLRSPMLLMSLALPVAILILFRFQDVTESTSRHPHHAHFQLSAASFGFPIGAFYALLMLSNLVFNAFGTDAAGVQLFFISPVRFREILAGKNLAYASLFGLELVIVYIAAVLIDGPPSAFVTMATLLGLLVAILADFAFGNVISLYLPKKMDLTRLGRQSARGTTGFLVLGVQAAVAALIAIAVAAGLFWHRVWITALVLAALALAAAGAYLVVLDRTDSLALTRREVLITELSKS